MTPADDLPPPDGADPKYGHWWGEQAVEEIKRICAIAARAELDAEIERLKRYAKQLDALHDEALIELESLSVTVVIRESTIAQRDERIRELEQRIQDLEAVRIGAEAITIMHKRAEAAEARVKALSEKENAADMCLQSVHEARKIIKEHLGGNCAFLDDDLVRWVARGLDEIKEERDALRARLILITQIICALSIIGTMIWYYVDKARDNKSNARDMAQHDVKDELL